MTDILLPPGRMVQGDLFQPQTKNKEGQPLVDKQGNPRVSFFMGYAVAKNAPGVQELIQQLQQLAVAAWPAGQAQASLNLIAQGTPPENSGFSWKYVDGDAPANANKDGFPGHYVFRLTNGFQPKVCMRNSQGVMDQITDPAFAKRGYFYRAFVSVESNKSQSKPGMYMNLKAAELIGMGEEIVSGPDVNAIFGGATAAALPAGAAALPAHMATPGAGSGMPAQPGAGAMPPGTPAHDFVQGPPAATAPPTMTAKAGGAPYESFITQGWTDDQLRANGYIV